MKAEPITILAQIQKSEGESYLSDFSDEEFCDPTDDIFDNEVIDPGNHLKSNEEIFTDKYMQDFAEKMDAKIKHEEKINRLISPVVILCCIFIVGLFSMYAYWKYTC